MVVDSAEQKMDNITSFDNRFLLKSNFLHIHSVKLSGNVEKNLGAKSYSAHDFIKIALLKAHLSAHKMDIVHLSDTFLNFSVPIDDGNLQILGYDCVRADYPSNTKHGVVLLYY